MKSYILILLTLCCFGCNNPSKQKANMESSKAINNLQDQEWLSWEGDGKQPHVVLISGDEEYRSEEALPQLAKILSTRHGFKCTVLFAQDPNLPGIIDPNYSHNIPGLELLETADMMILFTRFRALPYEQMKHFDNFLKSGKPVLGMRTATHAFHFAKTESNYKHYGNYHESEDMWDGGFGRLVLGEHWIAHHGKHGHQSTKGIIAPEAEDHPILQSIEDEDIWGATDVYSVRLPLKPSSKSLVLGQVIDRAGAYDKNDARFGMRPTDNKKPGLITHEDKDGNKHEVNQNDPIMPVAWVSNYQLPEGKSGKCFTTTMGASVDLLSEGTRRMLVNAVYWCLDLKVPEKANVDIVGTFTPSVFSFHTDEYWDDKKMSVASMK